MSEFIQGEDRFQATLFPERLDDYVAADSSVRVIDVFLDDLDLSGRSTSGVTLDVQEPDAYRCMSVFLRLPELWRTFEA